MSFYIDSAVCLVRWPTIYIFMDGGKKNMSSMEQASSTGSGPAVVEQFLQMTRIGTMEGWLERGWLFAERPMYVMRSNNVVSTTYVSANCMCI